MAEPLKKVLVDPSFRRMEEIFHADDLDRLQACCDVIWGQNEPLSESEIQRVKADAFAIVTANWRYGDLSEMPKLKAILEVAGRHPSPTALDYEYCRIHGIRVLSCAPAFGPMVAEMALGMAIDAAREITFGHELIRRGDEEYPGDGNKGTFSLYGKRVGLIGLGGLANALIPLLEPFQCQLQGFDPWRTDAFIRHQGVEPVDLDGLLETSQYIFVLAIPSNENQALLSRTKLEKIASEAVLVLMSRAHVVDFDVLTEKLLERRFRAAIDVFPEEPLPPNHPIRNAPNVVLSAHRAGSLEGDSQLIGRLVVDDIEALVNGLPPWHMQPAEPEIVSRLT